MKNCTYWSKTTPSFTLNTHSISTTISLRNHPTGFTFLPQATKGTKGSPIIPLLPKFHSRLLPSLIPLALPHFWWALENWWFIHSKISSLIFYVALVRYIVFFFLNWGIIVLQYCVTSAAEKTQSKKTCTPVFIAALFTKARTRKQPKSPLTDEGIKKTWYIYTMKYYSVINRNEAESFVETWIDLDTVVQGEVSPSFSECLF